MFNKIKPTMAHLCTCFMKGGDADEGVTLRRKMVIVGDGACGKTCLLTRMSTGNFIDIGYIPTVFETDVVNVNTGKENVDLVIFDTAGQEDYDRLRPFSYTDVDVVLICFSLDNQDTLTNVVDNWLPEIRYFCGNVPIILVGNKKDLRDAETSISSSKNSIASVSSSQNKEEVKRSSDEAHDDIVGRSFTTSKLTGSYYSSTRDAHDADILSPTSGVMTSSTDQTLPVRPRSSLYPNGTHSVFPKGAPVKHSEGVHVAKRIGAMAYFETSALTGDNVDELVLATTKAAVLGTKKSKKFKPFANTMSSWKSLKTLPSK